MHIAASYGHVKVAQWLLKSGVSLTDRDEVRMLLNVSELLDVFADIYIYILCLSRNCIFFCYSYQIYFHTECNSFTLVEQ